MAKGGAAFRRKRDTAAINQRRSTGAGGVVEAILQSDEATGSLNTDGRILNVWNTGYIVSLHLGHVLILEDDDAVAAARLVESRIEQDDFEVLMKVAIIIHPARRLPLDDIAMVLSIILCPYAVRSSSFQIIPERRQHCVRRLLSRNRIIAEHVIFCLHAKRRPAIRADGNGVVRFAVKSEIKRQCPRYYHGRLCGQLLAGIVQV